MRNMKKEKTFLEEKKVQWNNLMKDCENTFSLVTSMIDRLVVINERIGTMRQEIETEMAELKNIDSSMEQQYSYNTKIADKIKSFLNE